MKNQTFVLSGSDRISTRSYSRGVFPMGFRSQKSSKFRVALPPRWPKPPGFNGSSWSLGCLRKTHHSRTGATFLKIGPMPVNKIGGWGVCPTGKSISVSVAVQCVCACVRACVRAKLCAGVRTMIPPGLGRKIGSLWGGALPCRARPVPGPPRALSKIKNKTLVLSGSDRISTRSYSRGVFPMGFRPQKSSKFRVFFAPCRP